MTTPPPPPPQQPPQGPGPGTPEDQPQDQPGGSQDTTPAQQPPGFGAPQTPPAPPAAPQTPPAPPSLTKAPQPGYGYPQAPQASPEQPPAPGAPTPPPPQAPPAGPPQAPPGYGYPQQAPPAQPPQGYGYPTPPQPQGPYAAPQQPGPYGQPSPYAAQPGYGYPGQPGQPGQPGYGYPGQPTVPLQPQAVPGGGGRKVNAQLLIIVAAVVAIALIVGGGIWYSKSSSDDNEAKKDDKATAGTSSGSTGGQDDKGTGGTTGGGSEKAPGDPASKLLFQVPMPVVAKGDSVAVDGSWLTDKAYVKSGVAEVSGYDKNTGAKLWTVKLPGPVCEASRHMTKDYRTAVLFQPKMPAKNSSAGCSEVAALDLAAGKQLWRKTVSSGDYPVTFDNVTVSGNTVAAGSTDGGAAFDIASGKVLWSPKASDSCYDAGYGGGPKLVALRKCGSYDNPELHVQTIDPVSGKVLSEYKMTAGIEYASIVSTDPLVVAADVGDSAGDGSGISDFFSVDNKTGKLITRISAPGDQYAADCEGITRIEACTGLAVGAGRLYVPTEEHDGTGDYSRTNEVVAFDLATGKQTGQRADAGDGYTIVPLRMDGADVIAYKRPPYDKGGQIVSIDGTTFKQTTLMQNPGTDSVRDLESNYLPQYSEIIYSDGRLYMAGVYADVSSTGDKEYLAIGFGTGS
ncbi:outer membrane protein assembly factor BamB family protein [Streptomyces longwoodensis]|uniref:outer membrane protein assembly factor BamB family protein n=1 Tax=Streptomyces longwoodensis TaxID=68231 RepID=UPI0033F02E9E